MDECEHLQLDAEVKASRINGRSLICIRVWCKDCLSDFEITEKAERSIDFHQVIIEIKPAANLITDVSGVSH